ncbi:transposase (plasmid) [Cylindrospermum sp. NIES-4074]|nr:transposase [Cylindrospermum sp. NIES-4074]
MVAYEWVDKASSILNNKIGLDAAGVKQSYQELLTEMSSQLQKAGTLSTAIDNFISKDSGV